MLRFISLALVVAVAAAASPAAAANDVTGMIADLGLEQTDLSESIDSRYTTAASYRNSGPGRRRFHPYFDYRRRRNYRVPGAAKCRGCWTKKISGTCGAAGNIANVLECDSAAAFVNHGDTYATIHNHALWHKGCFIYRNGNLYHNTHESASSACSTTHPCLCRSDQCSQCPGKSWTTWAKKTSGTCGTMAVVNKDECEAAARAINHVDTTAYTIVYSNWHKGCFTHYDRNLYQNSHGQASKSCSTTHPCICRARDARDAKVNCVAKYGNWGKCTRQCGPGKQYRTRTIVTPALNGGSNSACAGSTARNCNVKPCAINCVGSWGAWGICDEACGGGAQTRKFRVSTHPSFGGTACPKDNNKPCNTQACCPVVRCPATPERGCTYQPSAELNANGCIKHPCGVKKCEKVCSHTKCLFMELPHKVGEQAVSIMQVVHNNKENMCSRHETVGKGNYIARNSQVHCAKVNDKTRADYGKCKCHKLGFHPNGAPVNNAAGSFAGSAVVHGGGTKAGQGRITEAEYNTALSSHQQNDYTVDASTRDGTDYAAHDGRVHS
jgi:hypothetical protein